MKLTEYTVSILKNFATLNSGIVLLPGKMQKTAHPDKSMIASAEVDVDFPIEFGIYDLNVFLSNVTTLNNPELTFSDNEVRINDGSFDLIFKKSMSNLIIQPPKSDLVLPDVDAKFDLPHETLTKILRLGAMNTLPVLSIEAKDKELYLLAQDKSSASSTKVRTKICDWSEADFSVTLKASNLRMLPDDYSVELKVGAFAILTSKTRNLKYTAALEKK
jgi:hypothetical protein